MNRLQKWKGKAGCGWLVPSTSRLVALFDEVCTSEMLKWSIFSSNRAGGGLKPPNSSQASLCDLWSTSHDFAPLCVFKMPHGLVQEMHLGPGTICFHTCAQFWGVCEGPQVPASRWHCSTQAKKFKNYFPLKWRWFSHPWLSFKEGVLIGLYTGGCV